MPRWPMRVVAGLLALLNVATWQAPARTRAVRLTVHAGNLRMLVFYIVWCVVKPEPPNYVAAGLLLLSVIAALSDAQAS